MLIILSFSSRTEVLANLNPISFTVLFNDDRVFYSLTDITAKQTIEHLCGNDLYQGIWELTENKLNLQWIVKGKTKDYIMKTQYIKS